MEIWTFLHSLYDEVSCRCSNRQWRAVGERKRSHQMYVDLLSTDAIVSLSDLKTPTWDHMCWKMSFLKTRAKRRHEDVVSEAHMRAMLNQHFTSPTVSSTLATELCQQNRSNRSAGNESDSGERQCFFFRTSITSIRSQSQYKFLCGHQSRPSTDLFFDLDGILCS